jgi:CDP-diacylglycerol--glycerol-3-phosphate 3-phosphatidyltransferase
MLKLPQIRRTIGYHISEPIVKFLAAMPISPNVMTCLGFLLTVGAAVLIATGHLIVASLVVLLASLFDILDGALARRTNRITRFGAILDSTLDRLSEAALLIGILVLFLFTEDKSGTFTLFTKEWSILIVAIALPCSLLVSYIRARAEAVDLDCQVGIFTRSERVVVLVLGLLLNQIVIALAVIVALSFITIVHRLIYVWQQTKTK